MKIASNLVTFATLCALLGAALLTGCFGTVDESVKTTCGVAGEETEARADATTPVPARPLEAPPTPALDLLARQELTEPLKLGTLLPETGSLAPFGQSMVNAAKLAVKQINDAGGVGGMDVELFTRDSQQDPTQAANAFNALVNEGVSGVAGAASSGVTGSILDLAIDNRVMVISPASTSPALTTERDNEGWFARVPPSDALQGRVLAELVHDDGCRSVAIMGVNNPYGVGLGNVFQETFEQKGGEVVRFVKFEEGGTTFTSQVEQAGQGDPDAIVFIGYPTEGGQIVKEAFQKGLMANSVFFFSEGVKTSDFIDLVGKDSEGNVILAHLRGTAPDSAQTEATNAFTTAFEQEYGEEPNLFARETFDAIVVLALAAANAGDGSGEAIKDNLRRVYNAPGTRVSAADMPAALLAAHTGTDIDYVGVANDFDLDENGDPSTGLYSYWVVDEDGTIRSTKEGITP